MVSLGHDLPVHEQQLLEHLVVHRQHEADDGLLSPEECARESAIDLCEKVETISD